MVSNLKMRNNLKRIFLILVFVTGIGCTNKANISNTHYVSDTINLLNNNQISEIIALSENIENKIGSQIIILIISSTGKKSVEQFSIDKAQELEIGRKEYYDGILITLAVNDRTTRIEVGYGLEKIISDDISGKIIREIMIPSFQKEQYGEGLINGVTEISRLIFINKELVGNVEGILR